MHNILIDLPTFILVGLFKWKFFSNTKKRRRSEAGSWPVSKSDTHDIGNSYLEGKIDKAGVDESSGDDSDGSRDSVGGLVTVKSTSSSSVIGGAFGGGSRPTSSTITAGARSLASFRSPGTVGPAASPAKISSGSAAVAGGSSSGFPVRKAAVIVDTSSSSDSDTEVKGKTIMAVRPIATTKKK